MERLIYDAISINPRGICTYKKFEGFPKRHQKNNTPSDSSDRENTQNISEAERKQRHAQRVSNNGVLSQSSIRKINKGINWMLVLSRPQKQYDKTLKKSIKYRINFVTLTLPSKQVHTDQKIKSVVLDSFLEKLRRHTAADLYLWRAEKQKNGNIHFHVIINRFLPYLTLKKWWNDSCNLLGYVDRYSEEMKSEIKSFGDYYEKFIDQGSYSDLYRRYMFGRSSDWKEPNSTDIHKVKKVQKLSQYLSKYMSKNVDNIETLSKQDRENLLVSGQIWGLSNKLSAMFDCSSAVDTFINDEIGKVITSKQIHTITDDYFQYFCITIRDLIKFNCVHLLEIIHNRIRDVGLYDKSIYFA